MRPGGEREGGESKYKPGCRPKSPLFITILTLFKDETNVQDATRKRRRQNSSRSSDEGKSSENSPRPTIEKPKKKKKRLQENQHGNVGLIPNWAGDVGLAWIKMQGERTNFCSQFASRTLTIAY